LIFKDCEENLRLREKYFVPKKLSLFVKRNMREISASAEKFRQVDAKRKNACEMKNEKKSIIIKKTIKRVANLRRKFK